MGRGEGERRKKGEREGRRLELKININGGERRRGERGGDNGKDRRESGGGRKGEIGEGRGGGRKEIG